MATRCGQSARRASGVSFEDRPVGDHLLRERDVGQQLGLRGQVRFVGLADRLVALHIVRLRARDRAEFPEFNRQKRHKLHRSSALSAGARQTPGRGMEMPTRPRRRSRPPRRPGRRDLLWHGEACARAAERASTSRRLVMNSLGAKATRRDVAQYWPPVRPRGRCACRMSLRCFSTDQ